MAPRRTHAERRLSPKEEEIVMYQSPIPFPEKDREQIAAALHACLIDGLDLHGQLKVAHWNVKGPHFAALHPLFEQFALGLAGRNDAIAERAVALGAQIHGTARCVARTSRLPEYPQAASRDLVHVKLLVERFEQHAAGLRNARGLAVELGDDDTADLVTAAVLELEKNAWFLRAMLTE
jgi:starvation-inducible DNA-binding protein